MRPRYLILAKPGAPIAPVNAVFADGNYGQELPRAFAEQKVRAMLKCGIGAEQIEITRVQRDPLSVRNFFKEPH